MAGVDHNQLNAVMILLNALNGANDLLSSEYELKVVDGAIQLIDPADYVIGQFVISEITGEWEIEFDKFGSTPGETTQTF